MKIYYIPETVKGLIFDIDLTLYDNIDYYKFQSEVLIKRLANEQKQEYLQVKQEIEKYRKEFAEKNNRKKPSLGNTFLHFGIPIKTSVLWREELHKPEDFLKKNIKLKESLLKLERKFKLIAVTNNPSSIGKRTINALGIDNIFKNIIGLDISMVSKPHERPFILAKNELNLDFTELVSIGDRFEVDLEIPLKLGMGGILINNLEDIYKLPDILYSNTE